MAENNLPPGLTLVDNQQQKPVPPGLTLNTPPVEQTAPAAPRKQPGIGEKALGVLSAPGFAAGQVVMHPGESAKTVGQGILDYPKTVLDKEKADIEGVKSGVQGAMDPNRSGISRTLQGGKAALNALAMPFEPITAGVENTYGRLAAEGSRMTQPDNKRLIGPGSASILPTLFLGGETKKSTEAADAIKRFGMDFSKAKEPEDIAKEMGRATDDYFSKLTSMIWDRTPQATQTGKVGEIAGNALKNFGARKDEEAKLWTSAEQAGNRIVRDHSDEITRLTELRKNVAERIKNGEDTPDVKKAQAMIDRALGELGAPHTPEPQEITKLKEVGGSTRTTTSDRQLAPKNEDTVKNFEPTNITSGNRSSQTVQSPITSTLRQDGKARAIETSPYTVTTKTIKGTAPSAPRAGTAADLVRARRAVNDSSYAAADGAVSKEVKSVLQDGLTDVSKANKEFGRTHSQALQKTQANADIYRDDAKAAKYGFDEDTLRDLRGKIKSGREISTDTLEKINNGVNKVKTPEDLLFLQRHLDKPEFSMALRAKAASILADVGTDYKKVQNQRPMLEKIYEFAGMPKAKVKQSLDDLETVAKEAERYGIPTKPTVDPSLSKTQQRAKAIIKALSFGMMGNAKQAGMHLGQAAMQSPNAQAMALQGFRKAAQPTVTNNVPAILGGLNALNRPGGTDQNIQQAITGPAGQQ